MGSPRKRISPRVTGASPTIARQIVDLPDPDSPTSPTLPPTGTWKLTSWTANTGVNGMFAKTSHVGEQAATFHIQVPTGDRLCILGGPTTGAEATATVTFNGVEEGTLTEDGTTPAGDKVFCRDDLPGDTLDVMITVDTVEPVTIDALYVKGES